MHFSSDFKSQFGNKHPLDVQVAEGLKGNFELGWQIAQFLKEKTPDCQRAGFNRGWYEMMRGDLFESKKPLVVVVVLS